MNANGKWYALFVTTGEEDNIKERIYFRLKGQLNAVVPKRKMKERKNGKWEYRIRALFPGYVLLNGHLDINNYNLIRDIPGIIRLLQDRDGPLEIDEQEIRLISRLTCDNETIGPSSVYLQGGTIVVIDGPLLGMEGYIQAIDKRKGRAKVLLNLMGEPRAVELSVSMVQLA